MKNSPAKLLLKICQYLIDFLLPSNCIYCKKEIGEGIVCIDCLNLIEYPKSPFCPHCGRPIEKTRTCEYCRHEQNLEHGRALALYIPPADVMIQHFKYRGKTQLAEFFGLGMATILKNDYYLKDSDLLIPVPLHWWKRMRRTYNQAELLAKVIGRESGIPVIDCLERIKNTKTQTRLDHKGRQENVRNAFRFKKNFDVRGKRVVIIDDVMTTGATIKECARILKEAGAGRIYALVAAITP